jgi:hypothetical protein
MSTGVSDVHVLARLDRAHAYGALGAFPLNHLFDDFALLVTHNLTVDHLGHSLLGTGDEEFGERTKRRLVRKDAHRDHYRYLLCCKTIYLYFSQERSH